jgi:ribosome-associated protein
MNIELLLKELNFKAVRSSGPGGQHVNKASTKVEVSLSIATSEGLSEAEKDQLRLKLKSKITSEGILTLQCGETRSQHRNKSIVIQRLISILEDGLKRNKPRKKTKPSKGAIEKRLKTKKTQGLKKRNRKSPPLD